MALGPRIGGGGGGAAKGRKILAWISYGFAIVGGAALVATGLITFFTGLVPGWVSAILFAGLFCAMAVDIIIDGEPNRLALISAMVLPSLAATVNGQLSTVVGQFARQVLTSVNAGLGSWLGVSGSGWAVAVMCIALAMIIARRVVAKGG